MDMLPLPVLAEHGDAVVMVYSPDPAAAVRASRTIRNASIEQSGSAPAPQPRQALTHNDTSPQEWLRHWGA